MGESREIGKVPLSEFGSHIEDAELRYTVFPITGPGDEALRLVSARDTNHVFT